MKTDFTPRRKARYDIVAVVALLRETLSGRVTLNPLPF
jgi:hypothetical protein